MLPKFPSLIAVVFALIALPASFADEAVTLNPSAAASAQAYYRQPIYRMLPLTFECNEGQTAAAVKFLSRGPGYSFFLTSESIAIAATDRVTPGSSNGNTVSIEFVNLNPSVKVTGVNELEAKTNYLRGRDPSKWYRNIANYSAVEYRGIYLGIDVRFYGTGNHIEHDFVVAPGADPGQIQLRIRGQGKPALNRDGDLNIATGAGKVTLKRPQIYQEDERGKRPIAGRYLVNGGKVTIKVGRYDKTKTLVIDPILVYSTYLGGSKGDFGTALAVDNSGNAYLTGFTSSPDFPTENPLQGSCNNCASLSQLPDVFVSKLNATGTGLVYSTFLGGSESDEATSIAIDSLGNAVVAGRTRSVDFPVASPIQVLSAGNRFHAFVSSISADGSTLNYSTYLGGISDDFATGVAVDSSRSAYVTGMTQSPDFPVTPGTRPRPAPPSFPHMDVFVVKISAIGAQQYGVTIHGGAAEGTFAGNLFNVNGIAVDSEGSAYITGSATAGWPTTLGSFQPNLRATPITQGTNAFVAKLKPDASDFVYSTYLGGSDSDIGKSIALDGLKNAYITGDTSSANFPVTLGAFQTSTLFCCRTFVTKINPSGSALVYSTLLSGTDPLPAFPPIASSIAVDTGGRAYVAGRTSSRNFPVVDPILGLPPTDGSFGGGPSAYVSQLNPSGSALLFSSYFGGSIGTDARAIALGSAGTIYLAGTSFDLDLPTTPGALQSNVVQPPPFTNAVHAFVAKFDLNIPAGSACIQPQFLLFPGQVIHTTSFAQTATLTNCGSAILQVNNITVPADYAVSGCTAALAPGASCVISVTFTPSQVGGVSGLLQISDDAAISPQKIKLQGVGVPVPAPKIFVSEILLTLDEQLVNTTSVLRDVRVSNSGNADLHIATIQISGNFAQSNNCLAAIPPQSFCVITVSFTPTAAGFHTGILKIFHDATGSPNQVLLQGTGVSQHPLPSIVTVTPPAVVAGSQAITLRVAGQDFFQNSVVRLDGVNLPTTYLDDHTLTVPVGAAALSQLGERVVTVFTPAPGGGVSAPSLLTVYRTLDIAAADLAFDKFSGRLFASVPSTAPNFANSIVAIDPATGQILQTTLVGNNPATLALSDNGQFLYVALRDAHAIRRLQLPSLAASRDIPLGASTSFGDLNAGDIQVIPGSPLSIVVAKEKQGTPSGDGVRVIDDNVKRTSELDGIAMHVDVSSNALAFTSDASVVYELGGSTLFRLGLSNDGVSILNTSTDPVSGVELASDGSLLYTNTGNIFDPTVFALLPSKYTFLGGLPTFQASVIPETGRGRTFFLTPTYNSFKFFNISVLTSILVYDQQTLAQVGSVDLPDVISGRSLVRWGTDGFAFASNEDFPLPVHKIILVRSRLTNPGIAVGTLSINALDLTRGNISSAINFKVSVPASFAGSVDLSCSGLPLAATCNFSPAATVTPVPGSPMSVILTIDVPRTAPTGFFNVTIQASSGAQVSTQLLQLNVNDYDLVMSTSERAAFPGEAVTFDGNLTNVDFYNHSVALSCAAGTTPAPSACSVSPSAGNPLVNTPFTVNATATQAQDFIFNVTGTGTDANSTVRSQMLVLHTFDFALGAFSQTGVTMFPSSISPATTLEIQPVGLFNAPVTLDCTGLPAGASCAFNGLPAPFSIQVAQNPVPVVLVITATQAVPTGTHMVGIRATAPGRPAGPIVSPFQLIISPAAGTTDLSVNAAASPPVMVGQPATVTFTAMNNGTSVANATLLIAFAHPERVQSALIEGGGNCSGIGAASVLVTCPIGALASGSMVNVTVVLLARFVPSVQTSASAISELADADLSNNSRMLQQQIRPRPLARRGLPPRTP